MTNCKPPKTADRADEKSRQDKIGDQLRKLYDDVASEPVPDEFLRLLEDADEPNAEEGSGDS